jgi:hypothetical protein
MSGAHQNPRHQVSTAPNGISVVRIIILDTSWTEFDIPFHPHLRPERSTLRYFGNSNVTVVHFSGLLFISEWSPNPETGVILDKRVDSWQFELEPVNDFTQVAWKSP